MNEKEFMAEFSKMRGSRINDIIHAVNFKIPKEEAGLKNDVERQFYDSITEEAEAHEKKYGFWPAFEMCEIEYDDPRLDIYKDPPEKWAKERKADRGIGEIEEG